MSVSINKKIESKSEVDEKNFFDSILFYSGIFKIDSVDASTPELLNNIFSNSNLVVKHLIQQASDPNRIGKELLRFVGFDKNQSPFTYHSARLLNHLAEESFDGKKIAECFVFNTRYYLIGNTVS